MIRIGRHGKRMGYRQKVTGQKVLHTGTKSILYFYLKQIGTYVSTDIKNAFYINIYNFLHIYQLSNLTQSNSMPYSLEEVFHTFSTILHSSTQVL